MAPFWSGMAIGIAGGLIIFAACVALFLVITAIRIFVWIPFAARQIGAGVVEAHAHADGGRIRDRNDRIRARNLARNERQREWLIRHRVPPRLARMPTRSMAG